MATRRSLIHSAFSLAAMTCAQLGAGRAADIMDGGGSGEPEVTAITQVFGDGLKLTAAAIEYGVEIEGRQLPASAFTAVGRKITRVYVNSEPAPALEGAGSGRFVIVELSPDDADALLYQKSRQGAVRKEARVQVSQVEPIAATNGAILAKWAAPLTSERVSNLIVDDFVQRRYVDPKSGEMLAYNLFVPKAYDAAKSYPLVLFMHDAGATSDITTTTLVQGLGAVVWASPADQARHEAFVVAPQYAEQVVNDQSEATGALDLTAGLVGALTQEFNIDRDRLYATGQSGGAMMSIALNIKYPDLFAASFIVAGQWDAAKVKPLANDRLWIVVSEGDLKAFPGQNAITAVLEAEGGKISRAMWDGRATAAEFATDVAEMEGKGTPINYAVLRKGTVVPPGQPDDGGSNHINTWRIAYTIDGIRDWLLRQRRQGGG